MTEGTTGNPTTRTPRKAALDVTALVQREKDLTSVLEVALSVIEKGATREYREQTAQMIRDELYGDGSEARGSEARGSA